MASVDGRVSIELLGEFRVCVNGVPARFSAPPRTIPVLAYLALQRAKPVAREIIAGTVWPDVSDDEARANLRRHLHYLTQSLPPIGRPWIVSDRRAIQWDAHTAARLDIDEFERLCARPQTRTQAVDLYRGDLLERYDDEWLAFERARLRSLQIAALEGLVAEASSAADAARTIVFARRLLQADPWREDALRSLIVARRDAGDRAGAIADYQRFALTIKTELAIEPMPETIACYRTICDDRVTRPSAAVSIGQTAAPVVSLAAARRRAMRQDTRSRAFTAPDVAAGETPAQSKNNLPFSLNAFVGREKVVGEIVELARSHRLTTLTGSGGIGKTSTALNVARALLEQTDDGVWLAEFAPLRDGSLVAAAIAQALGLGEEPNRLTLETLLAQLKNKTTLLIFDNCEHVIEAAATIAKALLTGCPALRIIATSREPLKIDGEFTYRLPSLGVPAPDALQRLTSQAAVTYGAVELFVDRARATNHGFTLTDDNAPIVADICRRLDGIPLAIELAAARVGKLSLHELRKRLDERFRLLTAGRRDTLPRQQTLRALIDWSHQLLDQRERRLLRRSSIFVNGFTLAGAVAVASGEGLDDRDVFDVLSSLVDKSLILTEPDADALRYRMLESTRVYAREKLEAAGELPTSIGRHRTYVRDLFAAARKRTDRTGRSADIDALLFIEREDVRAALDSITDRAGRECGAALLAAIDSRWSWTGLAREGAARLEHFISLMPADEPGLHARLWTAWARIVTEDSARAREATMKAVALGRAANDADALAQALTMRADSLARLGAATLEDAATILTEAEQAAPAQNVWLQLRMLRVRANLTWFAGDLDGAVIAFQHLRETHTQLRNELEACRLSMLQAMIEHERGRTDRALALVQEILPALRRGHDGSMLLRALTDMCAYLVALDRFFDAHQHVCEFFEPRYERERGEIDVLIVIEHLALAAALQGDVERAARLAGFTESARRRIAYGRDYFNERHTWARLEAILDDRLASNALHALRIAGSALSPQEAIVLVSEHAHV